jgi:hypothetical protein
MHTVFLLGKDKGKYIKSLHLREITLREFIKEKDYDYS